MGENCGQKDTKRPKNPYCHFWRARSKKQYWEQKQGTKHAPSTQHHQGLGNHLSHPSSQILGHTPTLTTYEEQAHPAPQGASKNWFAFAPCCCFRSPNRALSEFLFWLLVNCYWWGNTKNAVQYQYHIYLLDGQNLEDGPTKYCQGREETGTVFHYQWECKMVWPLWRTIWWFLIKVSMLFHAWHPRNPPVAWMKTC